MRRLRQNADTRLRQLERAMAEGDPDAEIPFHRELQRTNKAIPYYARLLLDDFAEDLRERQAPHLSGHAHAEFVLDGLLASPGARPDSSHMAQVAIPDRFGRRRGLMLSMLVMNEQATWTRASRYGPSSPIQFPSTVIRVCVALIHGGKHMGWKAGLDAHGEVNPLYFFHRNSERWQRDYEKLLRRALPVRMFCSRILAADLRPASDALAAIERALADAFETMQIQLGFVDTILNRATKAAGSPITAEAVRASLQDVSVGHTLGPTVEFLQTAPGPVIGARIPARSPAVRAWNASGDGVLEAALLALAEHLRRTERAVIQRFQADPYDSESGYFARGYLDVTSRRARHTRNPIRFMVDWDRVDGTWRDRGDAWIGNQIAPGGLWRINMVDSPGTAQALVAPAIKWIKEEFPDAEVMVAAWNEPGTLGRPDYRPE
jgi:hypothetical protein